MKKLLLIALLVCIKQVNAQIITTVCGNGYGAGTGMGGYFGDGGQATAAELDEPYGIAFDATGNYYISDNGYSFIRKVSTAGVITTFAGYGLSGGGYSGDGGQATAAQLEMQIGIAVDAAGNLYIADQGNNVIRKIVLSTGIITTVAGSFSLGFTFSGDGGQATNAGLNFPSGVVIDAADNLYFSDQENNRIRMVNTSGIITTIVGNGTQGYSGDGGVATAAEINQPYGIAIDATGNLYISDQGNNLIRKVNTSGIITTIVGNTTGAGTGSNGGYSGDGGQATSAEIYTPNGICFDASGSLYIADYQNVRIRKINTSGIITTVAGTGALGYTGDGGQATAATLNNPVDVRFNASGNLFIADSYNNVIREVCFNNCVSVGIEQYTNNNIDINIYPNPNNGSFVIEPNNNTKQTMQIYDVNGKLVLTQTISGKTSIDAGSLNKGVYNISLQSNEGVVNKRLIIVR